MTHRRTLPTRRNHTTQKVRIADQRTRRIERQDVVGAAWFGQGPTASLASTPAPAVAPRRSGQGSPS